MTGWRGEGVGFDGGGTFFSKLLDVREGLAFVSMGGGCQGCGLASVTLRQGVEKMIVEAVPSIRGIVDTTDHSLGVNPYYREAAPGQSPLS
jgi:Fe/S biogenesis protein NfuA